MTMKIEITIPEDAIQNGAASQYLKRALTAIGYERAVSVAIGAGGLAAGSTLGEAIAASPEFGQWREAASDEERDASLKTAAQGAADEAAAAAPKRERGKPAPGRARRTKEEIAEDEAADAAGAPEEPKAAISTGEERIDPTTVEDAAQDAADEAAEAETTKAAELTHDDVRAALKKYLDAYGTAAAMEDGPKVLKMLFGDTAAKVSDVPGDQDSLAKAIAGIDEMLGKNPFKREAQL